MVVYKLFRLINNKLYPLYVEADREMEIGKWLNAGIGELKDETHVKARGCGGSLSLRPGFHSTKIPFANWIGKRQKDGTLAQRKNTVWAECEVSGNQINITDRYGSRQLVNGWYYYKTNSKQKEPWIISNKIKINKILSNEEIAEICNNFGIEPQPIEK